MCDYNSPYAVYPNNKRKEVIIKDYMGKDWKETEDIKVAIKRYMDFQETHTM